MATVEAENGVCPEGYQFIFGNRCISKTDLRDLNPTDLLAGKLDLKFSDLPCEIMLGQLQEYARLINEALEYPRKIISIAKKILNLPTELINEVISSVMDALDRVNNVINELVSGIFGGSGKLISLLKKALDCPIIADSALGKQLAGMLDILNSGGNLVDDQVNMLKDAASSTADELFSSIMDTPFAMLSNLNKQLNSLIDSLGIDKLLTTISDLEQCIDDLCKLYKASEDFLDRLPKSSDSILKELGAKVDSATGEIKTTITDTVDGVSESTKNTYSRFEKIKSDMWG